MRVDGQGGIAVLLVSLAIVLFAQAATAQPRGDGRISLYNYHLKERLEVQYREGEQSLPQGLLKIQRLFRSRDSDETHPVDVRLIELLDRIEDHFQVRQVEVISGFRSPAFNRQLKEEGHDVARESLHIQGMAADIHLDEITEEALRDYAVSLKTGGVGFYPSLHMVHVDIGSIRSWGERKARKGWVGEKNDAVPLVLTVFPDRSLSKRLESVRIDYVPKGSVQYEVGKMDVQFFDRGQWGDTGIQIGDEQFCYTTIPLNPKVILLRHFEGFSGLPYGKFRLRAHVCGGADLYQYSNEFYFKKPVF